MSWNGTRVLVTGAEGFIGSHLVKRLLDEGARVHALIKKQSSPWRIEENRDQRQVSLPGLEPHVRYYFASSRFKIDSFDSS